MKILIIGGNRFFGKRLVGLLLESGHQVELLNRGNVDDGFGSSVVRTICDRTIVQDLKTAISGKSWDIVYDQVCYDYNDAKASCELFDGKVGKYIFTSSQSVYGPGEKIKELDFDPSKHEFETVETKESNYGEAKRQAEVAFSRHANFPFVAVRFPIVIGDDDYTKRFEFHVERIKNEKPIYFPCIDAKISFVTSHFAATTLEFLGNSNFVGPINVASPGPISLREFVKEIEDTTGQKLVAAGEGSDENHSPYGIDGDWYMDCSVLHGLSIKGSEISNWLPKLLS
ncbi:MAG: NAD-dependent epimerase/dehydratase family protein [Bacteriovoracaceae bacterium]|jgi:nucleoside-diphosphate-sugar epimerase|nr:NAD-dependent epimerase/dehydratase family protein [Bacteriovoracaceae bacterium]